MIVGPGYVYVATPKTGTRSIRNLLLKAFAGEALEEHRRDVPPGYRDRLVWTTVRDPYARAASLWWSTTMQLEDRYRFRAKLDARYGRHDLEAFLRWVTSEAPEGPLTMTQVDFLEDAGVREVLRMEDLPHCLLELPFVSELPELLHLNRSAGRPPLEQLMAGRVPGLVEAWAFEDLDVFGYARWRDR